MRSKQYFTSIKNNPHEISTDPESQQKYKSELDKASLQYKRMFSQYKEWQIKESDRVSKLKIIVPDALQTTYEKLSLLEE